MADYLRDLAVNSASSWGDNFAYGAWGGSGIALRGLSEKYTLILVDGVPVAPYGWPSNGYDSFFDLNSLPASFIERIEVVKSGAVSQYGSDASRPLQSHRDDKLFPAGRLYAGGTLQHAGADLWGCVQRRRRLLEPRRWQFGSAFSPRFALSFKPVTGLNTYFSYSRGFRAPTLAETSREETTGVQSATDPSSSTPTKQLGVPVVVGGNSTLRAEHTQNYNLGFEWQPWATAAFGVDLYRIAIHDVIGTPNIQALVDANDPSIVVRGANGEIDYVNMSNENLNSLVTDGLEVTGQYALPTSVGTFRLAADWAYVRKFAQTSYGVSVNFAGNDLAMDTPYGARRVRPQCRVQRHSERHRLRQGEQPIRSLPAVRSDIPQLPRAASVRPIAIQCRGALCRGRTQVQVLLGCRSHAGAGERHGCSPAPMASTCPLAVCGKAQQYGRIDLTPRCLSIHANINSIAPLPRIRADAPAEAGAMMPLPGHALDDEAGRSALAKASWRLLPLLGLGYCIAYIDRINISFAALQMNQDLHFSATIYGLGAGLFSLSYCLLEVPSNLLLARFGARRWISRIMLTWGVIAAGMMFVRTPSQFYVMRFLLGTAEAGFFPGVLFYLKNWYPAAHSGRAISRFYIAVPLGAAFMGAVSGPLLNLRGIAGLSGWQWLFLAEGMPAIVLSLIILFALPDDPAHASWLTSEERDWITSSVSSDDKRPAALKANRLGEALFDPLVRKLGLCNFLILGSNYAFSLSAPTLLKGATHWSATAIGFVMSGTALAGVAAMLFNGWHSDRHKERHVHVAVPLTLMAAALGTIAASSSAAIIVLAFFLYYLGTYAVQAAFWPIPSDMLRGYSAAVGLAAIGSIGMLGGFIGPYCLGLARDYTGDYRAGLVTLCVIYLVAAGLMVLMRPAHGSRIEVSR